MDDLDIDDIALVFFLEACEDFGARLDPSPPAPIYTDRVTSDEIFWNRHAEDVLKEVL